MSTTAAPTRPLPHPPPARADEYSDDEAHEQKDHAPQGSRENDDEDDRFDRLIQQLAQPTPGGRPNAKIKSTSSSVRGLSSDSMLCDECGMVSRHAEELVYCGECGGMTYCLRCDASYHSKEADLRQHFRQGLIPGATEDAPILPLSNFSPRARQNIIEQACQAVPSLAFHPALNRDPYAPVLAPPPKQEIKKSFMYRPHSHVLGVNANGSQSARLRPHSAGVTRAAGRAGKVAAAVSASTANLSIPVSPPVQAVPPAAPVAPTQPKQSSRPSSARLRLTSARAKTARPASARQTVFSGANEPTLVKQPIVSPPPQVTSVASISSSAHTVASSPRSFVPRPASHPLAQSIALNAAAPATARITLKPGEFGAHTSHTIWGRKSTPGELVELFERIAKEKQQVHSLKEQIHLARTQVHKKQRAVIRINKARSTVLKESIGHRRSGNEQKKSDRLKEEMQILLPSQPPSLWVTQSHIDTMKQENEEFTLAINGLKQNIDAYLGGKVEEKKEKDELQELKKELRSRTLEYGEFQAKNELARFTQKQIEQDLLFTISQMRSHLSSKHTAEREKSSQTEKMHAEVQQMQEEYVKLQMKLDQKNAEEQRRLIRGENGSNGVNMNHQKGRASSASIHSPPRAIASSA